MVKTPEKKKKLDSLMEDDNTIEHKPSEYINKKRKLTKEARRPKPPSMNRYSEEPQKYNFRKKRIQYEECDVIYE